jgi:long-chain fatty acid transport protein
MRVGPNHIALAIVASFSLQTAANAAGFQINELSASLQGNANAGAAAANNDVSAMFVNPATLGTLKRNQVYMGGSEILPNIKMSNASAVHSVNVPGTPPSNITANVNGNDSQKNITSPAFIPSAYLGWRLNDKLTAGLSMVVPYGLTTKYDSDSVLRFAALKSAVTTLNLQPAIAYQINQRLTLGAGLQFQYLSATFSNFNGPYTGDPDVDELTAANNATYLKANGWGYGYTLGGLFNPDEKTRIGLGYRSQISTQLSGNGQQFTSPDGIVPAPSTVFLFNAQTSVNGAIKTPAVLSMGVERDIADWTLKATAQINFWHTFHQLTINMPQAFATTSTIETKWHNSLFTAVGADYRASDKWIVRGGLAYDQTPSNNDYRDARIPDSDRYWLNLGTSYNATKNITIDGAYSHIFAANQSINVTQSSGASATSTVPLEVNQIRASYRNSVDIFALALRYSFN